VSAGLLLAVVVGAAIPAGLLLLAAGLRGRPDGTPAPPSPAVTLRRVLSSPALAGRWGGALAAGLVVLLLTRWPVAAAGIAALVAAWPALFGAAGDARAQVARLEALAAWAESLKDTIAGAVGLEAAIPRSIDVASPLIRPQLVRLAGRLRSRVPIDQALTRFADELDNPSADLIIAALIVNAKLRGPGLHQTLEALSRSAREELDMQRRVEVQRRGIRRGAQLVVVITVVFAVGLGALSRQYVAPYGSPTGQLMLAVVIGIFGAGFGWLRALSRADLPDRFIGGQLLPVAPAGLPAPAGRS
jgi:hypothetical protein